MSGELLSDIPKDRQDPDHLARALMAQWKIYLHNVRLAPKTGQVDQLVASYGPRRNLSGCAFLKKGVIPLVRARHGFIRAPQDRAVKVEQVQPLHSQSGNEARRDGSKKERSFIQRREGQPVDRHPRLLEAVVDHGLHVHHILKSVLLGYPFDVPLGEVVDRLVHDQEGSSDRDYAGDDKGEREAEPFHEAAELLVGRGAAAHSGIPPTSRRARQSATTLRRVSPQDG